MKEYTPDKEGKVRELSDAADSLIMVATDRISAADHILQNDLVDKGVVLTQMSKFWFDFTSDVVPNHMISTDVKDMPEFFRNEKFEGRSMMCRKLEMLPLECIVRGYITGSGWASYQETGEVCGIKLPEGLQESQQLPEPIFTPSTKAEIGDHDENISYEKSIEVLERDYPGHGEEYAAKVRDLTIAVYKKCADYAREHGIIIADTKFEFGLAQGKPGQRLQAAAGCHRQDHCEVQGSLHAPDRQGTVKTNAYCSGDTDSSLVSPLFVSVAQGTEHRSPKAGVGGSNPLWDTIKQSRKPFFQGLSAFLSAMLQCIDF